MRDMTHPVLGQVEVDDTAGPSWRATVALATSPVVLSFDPGDAPLDAGQVDALADVAGRLAEFDRSARTAMLQDWVEDIESEGAGGYLVHHVAELGAEAVAEAMGIETPLDAEQFVASLRLVHVAVRPDEPTVLDYTIDEDLTNYVLAVGIDANEQVTSINTES